MIQRKLPAPFLIMLILWGGWSEAQAQILRTDTTSNRILSVSLSNLEWGIDRLSPTDTNLQGFHLSHTPLSNQLAIQNQGMWGTAGRSLEMGSVYRKYFNEGISSYEGLRKTASDSIYMSGKPVSDLHYVQGYPQMINITAKHTQNLGDYASFGIDYRRLKMQNIYFNNLPELDRNRIPNIYNTGIYFRFDHPNSRYLLLVQATNNRVTNQETGGLINEGRFDSLSSSARLFNQSAPLPDAVNTFRDVGIHLHQFYTLGQKDSLSKTQVRLFHHLTLARNRNEFNSSQTDSNYFSHQYNGSLTADRQQFRYLNNEVGIGRNDGQWLTKISILQQSIRFEGAFEEKADYTNLFLKASGLYAKSEQESGFNAEFGITGYNKADVYLLLFHQRKLGRDWILNMRIRSMIVESDFQQRYFNGNHFKWANSFKKQQDLNGEIGLSSTHRHPVQLNIQSGSLKNYIYFRSDGYPTQHMNAEFWYKIQLNYGLNFKFWAIRNSAVYQQVNSVVLPLPKFIAKSTWLLKGWVFHENMYLESGIDFFYHSAFDAPVYNPATRQFLNTSGKLYGNYPIGDIFLDARIRTVHLMVRMHHVNQDLLSPNSTILSPGYPILPRSFSFGVRWILTN